MPNRIQVGNLKQGNIIQQMLPNLDIQSTTYTYDFGLKKQTKYTYNANMMKKSRKKN